MHQLELFRITPDGGYDYLTLDKETPPSPCLKDDGFCAAISWSQDSLHTKLAIPRTDFFDRVRSRGYAIWQNRWVVLWRADDQYAIAPLV